MKPKSTPKQVQLTRELAKTTQSLDQAITSKKQIISKPILLTSSRVISLHQNRRSRKSESQISNMNSFDYENDTN